MKVAQKTTYINGYDLIRALEKYASEGRLLPTTLFVTFDVADLYTMIPRQGALEALMRFLAQHLHRGRNWQPIDQRHHADGSSGLRHQLLCLQGQVLSPGSRWGDEIGIRDGLSEHLHVGNGNSP